MRNNAVPRFGGAIVLLALLLLGGCAELTTVREHPEFASQTRKVARVAILPPEVEFTRLAFTGDNERDAKQEASIASTLAAVAAPGFRERGFTVSEADLGKAIADDQDLAYELEQLRNIYNKAADELYDGKAVSVEESRKFKVTLGPSVNVLADRAEADGLVLIRYSGFSKSDGLMTKERVGNVLLAALTGVYYEPARSGGAVQVALIDGTTGEVLWCNVAGGATVGSAMILSEALKPLRKIGPPTHNAGQANVTATADKQKTPNEPGQQPAGAAAAAAAANTEAATAAGPAGDTATKAAQ